VKVVLDTNVVVSGTFFGGVPSEIVEAAKRGSVALCVSAEIVMEYHEILVRFAGPGSEGDVAIILDGLLERATVVAPVELPSQISADRDDDMFIACALAAGADIIVSGDKHLLDLQGRIPVLVMKPREALARIRTAT
jgi:putative PIN family toxin of toxin-antitoxin system